MTNKNIAIVQSICASLSSPFAGRSVPGRPSEGSKSTAAGLVGVLTLLGAKDRQEDDLQVEQQIPIPDVLHVMTNPLLHLHHLGSLPAPPVDLCPARDSWFDCVAKHVAVNDCAVFLVVCDRMRSRTHEREFAGQNLKELRKLVERSAPQELAELRHADIVLCSLNDVGPILAHGHRSELENAEMPSAQSIARLPEEDWPRRFDLDGQRNAEHRDSHEEDDATAQEQIFDAFD